MIALNIAKRMSAIFVAMNMSPTDAWRAAVEMRKKFPSDAANVASCRADQCFDLGDLDGFRTWNRITHTILEIERGPAPCEVRH